MGGVVVGRGSLGQAFARIARGRWHVAAGASALLVAACGGGDTTPSEDVASKERPRLQAPIPPTSTWSSVIGVSTIPAGAANLPDGKLLLWSGWTGSSTDTGIFDPTTGTSTFRTVGETSHDMFCPGTSNLPDGSIFIAGGNTPSRTSRYTASSSTWTVESTLNITRAYNANTLTQDGSVFTLGGSWSGGVGNKHGELWTSATGWRRLTNVLVDAALGPDPGGVYRGDNHMWLFAAPDGRVLQAGPSAAMNWITTSGNGSIASAGTRGTDAYSMAGNAVMYDIGKILKVGGSLAYEERPATNTAYLIDINAGVSVRQVASMAYSRIFANAVALPNGQVVVIGGQTLGRPLTDDNSVLVPEIWDPTDETFTPLPALSVPRNYHSVGLLLPDGRVLAGGGGLCGCSADHSDVQILSPHYLFNSNGTPATRPVITSAPATATHGTRIGVTTDSTVTSFVLMRLSSTTHTVNNDQRRIPLSIASSSGTTYQLDLPSNPGIVLPGYYMLFAMNAQGTPSVSATVRISGTGAPVLVSPGDRQTAVNTSATLALSATNATSYAATGLPAGLAINASTGAITGTATVAGLYPVTVSASNATATSSTRLLWRVTGGTGNQPPTVAVIADRSNTAGAFTSLALSAVDPDGDTLSYSASGLPPGMSVNAASGVISGTPTTAGSYAVTAQASDGRGGTGTRGFTWTITAASTNQPPTLAAVSNRSDAVGAGASLSLAGSDPDGDTLSFSATGLPPGLAVNATSGVISGTPTTTGSYGVTATVNDGRGGTASRSFTWTITTGTPFTINAPYVRLEATASANGGPWASMAEFNLLDGSGAVLPRTGWVASADSAETTAASNAASQALDGSATTIWHTAYSSGNAPLPHWFSVNLAGTRTIGGFRYLPRQDESNGRITAWRFLSSTDGVTWTQVVTGTFVDSAAEKTVYPFTGTAPANQPPTLAAVANQSGTVGQSTSLALAGSDPDGDALTYSATGLPPGLTIAATTGLVSGTPTTSGTYNATATVNDGRTGTASRSFTWTIAAATGNSPPTLTAVANQSTAINQSTSLALSASDPNGDTLSYSATGLPTGLSIAAGTGVISGTPTVAGSYSVNATVSDGRGGTASRSFTWTITSGGGGAFTITAPYVRLEATASANGGPWASMAEFNLLDASGAVLARTGWVASADSAETVSENGAASQALDGSATTIWHTAYSSGNAPLPHWFSVNLAGTRTIGGFRYLPRQDESNGRITAWRFLSSTDGVTWTQVVTGSFVDSAAEKTVYPFTGTAPANQPPTLAAVANQTGTVGQSTSLALAGSDPDGDALTYSATGLPPGLTIAATTGLISGTPTTSGTYNVTATVNDGRTGTASRSFTWTIATAPPANRPPTLAAIANQNTPVNQSATLALSASDPDGDALTWSASNLPPGLTIATTTGRITGTPTAAGNYTVGVQVGDGRGGSASGSFVWTVSATATLGFGSVSTPSPLANNGTAAYTATATGTNVRFRWDFGDGTAPTAFAASGSTSHAYTRPGVFPVTVTITDDSNAQLSRSFLQAVYLPTAANRPTNSGNLIVQTPTSGNPRVWLVNQDNNSIADFDAVTRARLGETTVGTAPRSIALASTGLLWVTNKQSGTVSVVNPSTRAITRTISLPRASLPFGVAMAPTGNVAYVVLEGTGQLLKYDSSTYALSATLAVGPNPRHVSVSPDGTSVYVSRFVTPPLPGEATATVDTTTAGAEVVVVNAAAMTIRQTIVLRHSERPDIENQGRGIPNYLGAATISPDGTQAWVPSKQDNIKRGRLRNGVDLNFQNSVRAISSRIALASASEDLAARIDHDNASVASAAVFDPRGAYLFVALETSREIAVLDAHNGTQLLRIDAGRAPQGLAMTADGSTLFVNNFMDRTVGAYDLRPLLTRGESSLPLLGATSGVGTERLAANVLLGKQHFYDARDTRLARDRYISCASCHNDGGRDGRVWDFTGFGEGLRSTIALRGRAGGQGLLHWSANFDEVQDFEGQIRQFAGGTGLMSDTAFNTGTRSQPLGDRKTGVSADLDALAAYVASLNVFDNTPFRSSAGALTTAGSAGRTVFVQKNCASCHGGAGYTLSGTVAPASIGTIKPSSGTRSGGALTGIDIPTLRSVWTGGPYLHDGSAATLEAAVLAHTNVTTTAAERTSIANFLNQIGAEEPAVSSGPTITAAYVRLEATTTANGGPWASMAEFNLLDAGGAVLARTGWVASADSAETVSENGAASRAIDGSATTIWHTAYSSGAAPLPHWFSVNLGGARTISGFRYLPRQDESNGRITAWRFLSSNDGVTWTQVATGSFVDSAAEKTFLFGP